MALDLNQQSKLNIGGLSNNGAVPKTNGVMSGYTLPNSNPIQKTGLNVGNQTQTAQVSQGVNPGILPKDTTMKGVSTPPVITVGNKSQIAKGNPSVVAQQKALNEANINTPGYVAIAEDGFYGDKTKAAFAQYGYNTQTGQPNTPKTQSSTGSTQSSSTSSGTTPETPKPTTPQVGSTKENAQTVLNSGQMTTPEQTANQGLLNYGQGQESPQVVEARKNLLEAQKQFAQQTSDINQSGTWTSRALGEQGQANIKNSAVLNALQGTLSSALSSQGQQIGALGTAQSGAQTQAGRATGTAGTVLSASLPGQISGSTRTYNPLDPTGTSTIESGVANQSKYDLLNQYNQGKVTIEQAKGIEGQIANTLLSNPDINNQPVSFLTNLNQFISGQLGSAPQQLLAQQVNSYIQTLKLDPAAVVSVATQQKGTLKQLLQSLRDTAVNNNEALKTTADGLSTTSGSSSGGGYAEVW